MTGGAHSKVPRYLWNFGVQTRGDWASAAPLAFSLTLCFGFLSGIGYHLAVNSTEANIRKSKRTLKNAEYDRYSDRKDTGLLFDPDRFDVYKEKDARPPKF